MVDEACLIVVPAYNEERVIGKVLDKLKSRYPKPNVLVINDGSEDDTGSIARKKEVRVLDHCINRGLGAALSTGLKVAKKEGYEYMFTYDADGQHSPEDIKNLWEKRDEADLLVGSRLLSSCEDMPKRKRMGNHLLNWVTYALWNVQVTDSQSGLRLLNRSAIESISVVTDRYEVSSHILAEARKRNLRIKEIPIEVIYTDHSRSKGTNVAEGIRITGKMLINRLRQ